MTDKMKNLLIIYPHWHPVNLAGVHRPRLVGNFLSGFGWKPVVLTVQEDRFEEEPDPDFAQTFSKDFEVHRVGALPVTKPRIVGDIGLRAFFYLYMGAIKIIKQKEIDFVWIPIPSFYTALLGRLIYRKTRVPYGIDYIDPWVRDISTRKDWRHRVSNLFARILEPIALENASLITGVSYEYYKPVLDRNFKHRQVLSPFSQLEPPIYQSSGQPIYHTAFPYGFDPNDHKIRLDNVNYPWSDEVEKKPWIYAGAFLPNSRMFLKLFFEAINEIRKSGKWDEKVKLYFIGTGAYLGKSILAYATDAGIGDIVIEDRNRFPYLHVLNFLSAAETVMVIGSTEKHYTASKVYQALLSEQPIWAIFHEGSTAVQVMEECMADQFLVKYQEGMEEDLLKESIKSVLVKRIESNSWNPDLNALDKYSAKESARKLVEGMEAALRHAELVSASVQ